MPHPVDLTQPCGLALVQASQCLPVQEFLYSTIPPCSLSSDSIKFENFISRDNTPEQKQRISSLLSALTKDPASANILAAIANQVPGFKISFTQPNQYAKAGSNTASVAYFCRGATLFIDVEKAHPENDIQSVRHELRHLFVSITTLQNADPMYRFYIPSAASRFPMKMQELNKMHDLFKRDYQAVLGNGAFPVAESKFNELIATIGDNQFITSQKYYRMLGKENPTIRKTLEKDIGPKNYNIQEVEKNGQRSLVISFLPTLKNTRHLMGYRIQVLEQQHPPKTELVVFLDELYAHLHDAFPPAVLRMMLPGYYAYIENFFAQHIPARVHTLFDQPMKSDDEIVTSSLSHPPQYLAALGRLLDFNLLDPQSVKDFLAKYDHEKIANIESHLENWISRGIEKTLSKLYLAEIYFMTKNYEKAMKCYKELFKHFPESLNPSRIIDVFAYIKSLSETGVKNRQMALVNDAQDFLRKVQRPISELNLWGVLLSPNQERTVRGLVQNFQQLIERARGLVNRG